MKTLTRLLSFFFLLQAVVAIGQNATIAFRSSSGSLKLASPGFSAQIVLNAGEWPGVLRVASDLALDFGRVTGTNGSVQVVNAGNETVMDASLIFNVTNKPSWNIPGNNSSKGGVIIAGTIGKSPLIDSLIKAGKINVDGIQGKWEAFTSTIVSSPIANVSQALVIAGSDRRGTIFGLYDVSEQIGVSPWYWFADVPSQKHDEIHAIKTTKVQRSPSVKYRGFFINDEAPALTGWMNERYKKSQYNSAFGAEFYSRVFELLLRLRANYLWPAMWGSMFDVDDPRSQPLADEYGVVMGTSHTEPMMRATNEQTTFMKGPWQWNLNNASMYPFMEAGAKRAKPYDSLYTMGARGNGDTALNGDDAVAQLEGVISAQREILGKVYGNESDVPQMWCLYKEVQGYYEENGLRVPDDVTLLWVDDNYGNIRRLPVGNETSRPGGAGVYYHFDYVGSPRNYKWINTIQLQHTWEQMTFAYKRDAQVIWIVNVGDIKPLEIPISHFFDIAYDIDLFLDNPNSTAWWVQEWATREFGSEHAKEIAEVVMTYSNLAGLRKYELVDTSTYSVINYEESDKILGRWQALAKQAQSVGDKLDDDAQAAFFEMVLHPVLAGGNYYDVTISSAKNKLYAMQGRTSANIMAEHVLDQWDYDHDLSDEYNNLLDGKWTHMMDQTHFYNDYWQGPMRQLTPGLFYIQPRERGLSGDVGFTIDGTNASVPADDKYHDNSGSFLTFKPLDPYLSSQRWIDVFSQGTNNITWTISAEPFVKLTQSSGTVSPSKNTDVRVYVTIDWDKVPASSGTTRLNLTSSTNYGTQYSAPYLLLPYNRTSVPSSFKGFVESEGAVSIEAEHYSRITGNNSALSYLTIPDYGRTLSAVTLTNYTAPSLTTSTAPGLEYDFYSFSNTTSSKPTNITLILGTSLNTIPARPLKYAIAVDDQVPKTVQYVHDQTKGNTPVGWEKAVSDAAWYSTSNATITGGKHTLKIWALEPGVLLQKIIVDFGGVRQSYLGPPESKRL